MFFSQKLKLLKFFFMILFAGSIIGFNPAQSEENTKKVLVVYFSVSGNTRIIAEKIQKELKADICRIETVKEYPTEYDELTKAGKREIDNKVMPELKLTDKNVKDYDVIIIGTPTWWYTATPAIMSFISNNDFSDKTVCFFMTNGGYSGAGINHMKIACNAKTFGPDIKIEFEFPADGKIKTPEKVINEWINKLKKI